MLCIWAIGKEGFFMGKEHSIFSPIQLNIRIGSHIQGISTKETLKALEL